MGDRLFQVVLIQLKDAAKFGEYGRRAGPIVAKYGGGLERMMVPQAVYGEGFEKPDVVNVVFYDSAAAYAEFEADPAFIEIEPLRSASIDMVSVEGAATHGRVVGGNLADRLYVVEIARYGDGGEAAYRAYEAEAEPVMAKYGYHVERVIAPDREPVGLPFTPDIVKIGYFETSDGMDRLSRDPAHPRIEGELYDSAVAESVWLICQVHPATLTS